MLLAVASACMARRTVKRLRRAEQRQRRLVALSRRRNQALAAANEDLRLISLSLSHDMRQPLATIRGFLGAVMRSPSLPPDSREHYMIARSDAAAARMDSMVQDLASLLKVAGAPLHAQACDVSGIAREVVQGLRASSPIDPQIVIADGLHVWGDSRLLRIVLENLIGNAWKFSARVAAARIEIGSQAAERGPVYFVKDNGAGFEMAQAEHLFQPFTRLHHVEDFPGSGLGLSIVHKAIVKHGGRIWVESAAGVGTCVFFTLPTPLVSPEARQAQSRLLRTKADLHG